ncbi:MAG: hypothetical protein KIT57_22840 [Blastocatellales bacterium]|nr:hypothetical protein [Blastocatellales bacterium]
MSTRIHGYELEHNYGHGRQTLSDGLFEPAGIFSRTKGLGVWDRLYQQCRSESLASLWTMLRSAFYLIEFDSWDALLLNHLSDESRSP